MHRRSFTCFPCSVLTCDVPGRIIERRCLTLPVIKRHGRDVTGVQGSGFRVQGSRFGNSSAVTLQIPGRKRPCAGRSAAPLHQRERTDMTRVLSLTRVAAIVVAVWLAQTVAPARTTSGEVEVMTR